MNIKTHQLISELRVLVGFLGEKGQSGWWDSQFYSSSSEAFLRPIFARTTFLSQFIGINEASTLIHDERIGLGQHFHLYRLPSVLEKNVLDFAKMEHFQAEVKAHLKDSKTALQRLKVLCPERVEISEGPVIVGDFLEAELHQLIVRSGAHYAEAFERGYMTFPYLRKVSEF